VDILRICVLDLSGLMVWAMVQIYDNLVQDYYSTCFEINFLDRQEGSVVSSIIGDCWWYLNIYVLEDSMVSSIICEHWLKTVVLKCYRGLVSVRIKNCTCSWILKKAMVTALWPESRQIEVIWEPAWPVGRYLGSCMGCGPKWVSGRTTCHHLRENKYHYRVSPNIHQSHSHPCISHTLTS